MDEMYCGGFSGHFTVKRSYTKLSRRYRWPGMNSEVRRYCLNCAAY